MKDNMILSPPQCQYFVVRKKRLCRMTVRPGRDYCGEHEPQPRNEKGKDDTRIPCPYDPKHTCYASKLPKHLAVCNARRPAAPAYLVRGVNGPPAGRAPRTPLARFPPHKILALIDKVNILYDKHVKGTISEVGELPIHAAVQADFLEGGRAESSRRHLRQASSLLHLLEAEGLVRNDTCYVELGAGKGHLSYYAYRAWCGAGDARVLLVDRASLRHKRDNKLRPPPPPQPGRSTVATDDAPATSDDAPVTMDDAPASSNNAPSTSDNTSATSDNAPTTSINAPATSNDAPATSDDAPPTWDHAPSTSNNAPITSDYAPATSAVVPDTTTDTFPSVANAPATSDVAATSEGEGAEVAGCVRIRADLADLVLGAVPLVARSAAVVGFAKHLCGVATDYAARCVCASGRARGLALATCCHHRCEPAALAGAAHLQEMGISAEELDIMLGVVSWATCGDGRSREARAAGGKRPRPEGARGANEGHGEEAEGEDGGHGERARLEETEGGHGEGLDESYGEGARPEEPGGGHGEAEGARWPGVAERARVGRRAKALLDYGRVLWLRAGGFRARLVRYVPPHVSPENLCIVATRD